MSADRGRILKAFTLAHRCGENPEIGDKERKYFRAIAHEIWCAVGEPGTPPPVLPEDAERIATGAEAEASGRKAYEEATRG